MNIKDLNDNSLKERIEKIKKWLDKKDSYSKPLYSQARIKYNDALKELRKRKFADIDNSKTDEKKRE